MTIELRLLDSIWGLYKLVKSFRSYNLSPLVEFKYGTGCLKRTIGCEFVIYSAVIIPLRSSKIIAYGINPYYTHILCGR